MVASANDLAVVGDKESEILKLVKQAQQQK